MRAISRPEVLTRYLAKELGARGIVVSAVAPDAIATDFSGGMVRDNPEVNQRVADMTALAESADDIGPMIASLLSEDHHWVNAQRIEASGARNKATGEEAAARLVAEGIDARFIAIDVADYSSIKEAATTITSGFGRIEILVNNAGINDSAVFQTAADPNGSQGLSLSATNSHLRDISVTAPQQTICIFAE